MVRKLFGSEPHNMSFEKGFGEKLYIPRDAEENPDYQAFAVLDDLSETLDKDPQFVGVAPFGSRMRGYSMKDRSDLDVMMLIDATEENKDEVMGRVYDETVRVAREKQISMTPVYSNVNMEGLMRGLKMEQSSQDFVVAACAVADLCEAAKGRKVKSYQHELAAKLTTLDPEIVAAMVDLGGKYLAQTDVKNIDRLNERKSLNLDAEEYFEKRKQLWMERIKKILDLQAQK
jgi:hypothetical protein